MDRRLSKVATKYAFDRQSSFMRFFEEAAEVIVDARRVCDNFVMNDVFGCMDRMEDFLPKLIDNFCEESLERIWCHRGAQMMFDLRLKDLTVAQTRMMMRVLDIVKKTELEDDALQDVKVVYLLLVLVRDLRHHQLLKAGGREAGAAEAAMISQTPAKKRSRDSSSSPLSVASSPSPLSPRLQRRHQRIMTQVKLLNETVQRRDKKSLATWLDFCERESVTSREFKAALRRCSFDENFFEILAVGIIHLKPLHREYQVRVLSCRVITAPPFVQYRQC